MIERLNNDCDTQRYTTAMVGKWHLGFQSPAYLPTYRGFDSFFGFVGSYINPWNKTDANGYVDLFNGTEPVMDAHALSSDVHTAHLFSNEAVNVIHAHEPNGPGGTWSSLFLYYAPALVHESGGYTDAVPDSALARCTGTTLADEPNAQTYCAMLALLDDSVSNITCATRERGWEEDTVIVFVSGLLPEMQPMLSSAMSPGQINNR